MTGDAFYRDHESVEHEESERLFWALPEGWTAGHRAEDDEWVQRFGQLDFPERIGDPSDALPPGFAAYTAVLHTIEGPETGRRLRWISDSRKDPWSQVQTIVDEGLEGWRFATDVGLGRAEATALTEELGLLRDSTTVYTCAFFVAPYQSCTATGAALAASLAGDGYTPPQLWFPQHQRWVANAPYDAGWTYIASDDELAERLRERPDIETLRCTYRSQ